MALFPNPFNSFSGLPLGRLLNLGCVALITGTALLWRGSAKSGQTENISVFLGIILISVLVLGVSIWLQVRKKS